MNTEHLKLGDRIKSDRAALRSGAGEYGAGVVGCLDPFLVVSPASDMLWSTLDADDFDSIGPASAEVINAIQRRLPPSEQFRAPYGESLLSAQLGCGLTLTQIGVEVLAVDLNEKIKTWPCMGSWAQKIAQDDNTSYGWVFRYAAAENLWRASYQASEEQLKTMKNNAKMGMVVTHTLVGEELRRARFPAYMG